MSIAYADLAFEKAPKMIVEGVKLLGVSEVMGTLDDPTIMSWADELGLRSIYIHDATPWCGLYLGVVAKRAGKKLPPDPLWALNWANFGNPVPDVPSLGDVLTFRRTGGGHVALYVGEDDTHFHILGGNQSDKVSIVRRAKAELYRARRPAYTRQPPEVRVIRRAATGAPVSTKES
jgi:uncharacterized protein (TIGR02594 family)